MSGPPPGSTSAHQFQRPLPPLSAGSSALYFAQSGSSSPHDQLPPLSRSMSVLQSGSSSAQFPSSGTMTEQYPILVQVPDGQSSFLQEQQERDALLREIPQWLNRPPPSYYQYSQQSQYLSALQRAHQTTMRQPILGHAAVGNANLMQQTPAISYQHSYPVAALGSATSVSEPSAQPVLGYMAQQTPTISYHPGVHVQPVLDYMPQQTIGYQSNVQPVFGYMMNQTPNISYQHSQPLAGLGSAPGAATPQPSAQVIPPDDIIRYSDFIRSNGPMVRFHTFLCLNKILVSSMMGAKVVSKAFRYVISQFVKGKSWGGKFSIENMFLRMRNGLNFFINLEATEEATPENLRADLSQLADGTLTSFKVDEYTAIWVSHLFHICKSPPQIIYTSEFSLRRFVRIIYYHPFFAHPKDRLTLTKGFGMLLKYCGTVDHDLIINCLHHAFSLWRYQHEQDWTVIARNHPILCEVFWFGQPRKRERDVSSKENLPDQLFIHCRHSAEHLPEHNLLQEVEEPAPVNANNPQANPAVPGVSTSQSAPAGTSAVVKLNQASQAVRPVAPKGKVWVPKAVPSPGGPSQSPSVATVNEVQGIESPIFMDFIIGEQFGLFIADGIMHIIMEELLKDNQYVLEEWDSYTRSCDGFKSGSLWEEWNINEPVRLYSFTADAAANMSE